MALPQVGLEAVIENLSGFQAGAKSITKAYDDIDKKAGRVEKSSGKLSEVFLSLGGNLLKFGAIAGAVGIGALAVGIGGVVKEGLSFNDAMEQASARINAFTKDSAETAKIIESIRLEAAKTPFTFQQMTDAVASLMPATKQSGESLDSLLKTAEILAASNPLQGLEGASFSLREAISGDFTSIIERFNLSRDAINKLKEEGVPALEIVRRVMQDMGLDAALVANMANTLQGRWSTFTDTMTTLAGTITQPLFDTLSASLGELNVILANNEPLLQGIAQALSGGVAVGIQTVVGWTGQILTAWTNLGGYIQANFSPQLTQLGDILTAFWTEILPALQMAWQTLGEQWNSQIMPALAELAAALGFASEVGSVWEVALGVLKVTLGALALGIKAITPLIVSMITTIKFGIQVVTAIVEMIAFFRRGLNAIADVVNERVTPIISRLISEDLSLLKKGLDAVTRAIKEATGFFKGLTDAVNNFSLPPLLTPGSPTPFELALLGIANAADQAGLSMQNLNNLSMPGMFDKLFKINRGVTDFNRLMQEAKNGIISWGKANFIGSEKSNEAIRFFRDTWQANFDKIVKSGNPLETWTKMIDAREWRLIGLKNESARKMGKMFFEQFFNEADKAADKLQGMIISGSQSALQMAGSLNQFAQQQADYLASQVEMLQEFVAGGQAELNFEGRIINAAQAQDLLNQKLEEQRQIQDDILQIKQQESKLQFLEKQLDLIKMVRDAGLNVKDVLGNITFGLDASIPDMIEATNSVISAIINQVDTDLQNIMNIGQEIGGAIVSGVTDSLGIASDSKVMARLGAYTMSGFVSGMMSQVPNLFAGVQQAITGPAIVSAPVLAGSAGQTIYMENNFGGNTISGGMDQAQFDAMVLRSLQRLMG